jgi:hypothetical protein
MSLFTRDLFAAPDDEAGVFIDGLGRALVTWVAMQDRVGVTVHDAASAFNTTPEVIAEAAEEAAYIYVEGDVLELDGA